MWTLTLLHSQLAECTPVANHIIGCGSSLMQGQERSSETKLFSWRIATGKAQPLHRENVFFLQFDLFILRFSVTVTLHVQGICMNTWTLFTSKVGPGNSAKVCPGNSLMRCQYIRLMVFVRLVYLLVFVLALYCHRMPSGTNADSQMRISNAIY